MAWTNTVVKQTVFGDERVIHYDCLADAATAEIVTGLNTITQVQVTYMSAASGNMSFRKNVGVASTAAAGSVSATGCASGDEYYITVYGK